MIKTIQMFDKDGYRLPAFLYADKVAIERRHGSKAIRLFKDGNRMWNSVLFIKNVRVISKKEIQVVLEWFLIKQTNK